MRHCSRCALLSFSLRTCVTSRIRLQTPSAALGSTSFGVCLSWRAVQFPTEGPGERPPHIQRARLHRVSEASDTCTTLPCSVSWVSGLDDLQCVPGSIRPRIAVVRRHQLPLAASAAANHKCLMQPTLKVKGSRGQR